MSARVKSGDILENDLKSLIGVDTSDKATSRLWNGGNDTDFITDNSIHKAGLTATRPSEECHISYTSFFFGFCHVCMIAIFDKRRVFLLRVLLF